MTGALAWEVIVDIPGGGAAEERVGVAVVLSEVQRRDLRAG